MAPSAVNNAGRADEGILARWHKDTNCSKASTGSANAYVFAADQTISAYYDGLIIGFDANFANTGPATLNVDAVAAAPIKKHNTQDLEDGDIEVGQKVVVVYDGTNFQMLSGTQATSYNVKRFGAKVDGVEGTDGATTDASTTFTSAGAAFTSDDVGKHISIEAVGAGTTITAVEPHNILAKHVWQVDDTPSDNAFVDITDAYNDVTVANCTLFPATEAIGDYAAFGYGDLRDKTQIEFDYTSGTAGVGGVVTWEYWNDAWTALAGVVDNTISFTAVAGKYALTFTAPSDATTTTISTSPSLYWIRARITTVYTTNPVIDQGQLNVIRIDAVGHTFFNDSNFDDQRTTVKGVVGTTEANTNFAIDIPRTVVTNAVDNGGGLIRITDADHPYVTGDNVTIADVRGTTEANAAWTVTKIDADTYDLDASTFTNAFTGDGRAKFTDKFIAPTIAFVNAYTSGGTAHGPLSTTIATFVSATQITLTAAASATATAQKYFYGTDNTTEVQAAVDAANNSVGDEDVGGGFVDMPAGICVHGKITHKDRVVFRGVGIQTSVWKAIGGLDDDLFVGDGFATLTGTNKWKTIDGVLSHVGFRDCQVDGSKRFQRANGDGWKMYGKAFLLDNLLVRDCKGNGIFTEAGATVGQRGWYDEPPGSISSLFARECGGHGWHFRGGHDAVIKQFIPSLNGGEGFRAETSSTYSGICDIRFMHSTANKGYGLFSNTGIRCGHYIADSNQREGLYLENADNFYCEKLHSSLSGSVIGDYQVVIDSATTNASLPDILVLNGGRQATGGVQINADRCMVKGLITGGALSNGASTGVGLDIPANADRNDVDVIITNWAGVGATGLRTGNATSCRHNRVRASLFNCSTLWNNVSLGVCNRYEIIGDATTADTRFTGVGPATVLQNREIWDVVMRDNAPSSLLSESNTQSGSVDFNITTEQTFSVAHNLLTTPPVQNCELTLNTTGTNAAKALQFMEVRDTDATNVDIAIRFDTAAGGAATGFVAVHAHL